MSIFRSRFIPRLSPSSRCAARPAGPARIADGPSPNRSPDRPTVAPNRPGATPSGFRRSFFQCILQPSGRRRASVHLGAIAAAAALIVAASLRAPLQPAKQSQPAFAHNDEEVEQVNNSPFALVMGEVRASVADLMWIKTERYLHRGVAYQPHIDAGALARTGEAPAVVAPAPPRPAAHHDETDIPGHADHDERAGVQTIIPPSNEDYRGFVGRIQREVQPWNAPGAPDEHSAGEELLPWYRMLTISNPHHWRGYMIGSWWLSRQLARDPAALGQAFDFIAEGIRNNPEVFQLRLVRGRLLLASGRHEAAIEEFRAAAALGLIIRPADGRLQPPLWTESEEEDFATAVRYIPLILWRHLGQVDEARASVQRARRLVPDDRPLRDLEQRLTESLQGDR